MNSWLKIKLQNKNLRKELFYEIIFLQSKSLRHIVFRIFELDGCTNDYGLCIFGCTIDIWKVSSLFLDLGGVFLEFELFLFVEGKLEYVAWILSMNQNPCDNESILGSVFEHERSVDTSIALFYRKVDIRIFSHCLDWYERLELHNPRDLFDLGSH